MKAVMVILFALLIRHFWSWISLILALVIMYFLIRGFIAEVCGEIIKLFQ